MLLEEFGLKNPKHHQKPNKIKTTVKFQTTTYKLLALSTLATLHKEHIFHKMSETPLSNYIKDNHMGKTSTKLCQELQKNET